MGCTACCSCRQTPDRRSTRGVQCYGDSSWSRSRCMGQADRPQDSSSRFYRPNSRWPPVHRTQDHMCTRRYWSSLVATMSCLGIVVICSMDSNGPPGKYTSCCSPGRIQDCKYIDRLNSILATTVSLQDTEMTDSRSLRDTSSSSNTTRTGSCPQSTRPLRTRDRTSKYAEWLIRQARKNAVDRDSGSQLCTTSWPDTRDNRPAQALHYRSLARTRNNSSRPYSYYRNLANSSCTLTRSESRSQLHKRCS